MDATKDAKKQMGKYRHRGNMADDIWEREMGGIPFYVGKSLMAPQEVN